MWLFRMFKKPVILFLGLFLLLSGCKEVLYSQLNEAEANEMVALLVLSGIPASREKENGRTYAITVKPQDLAVAVTALKNAGLPREKFSNFGEVFGDSGVVGTPFEERVRFAYATSEELAHTISQIKGVERARVHVVIPPQDRFGKSTERARAAVAVFHDQSFDPSQNASRIKTVVAFAVPKLDIDDVAISFFVTPGFVVRPMPPQPDGAVAAADLAVPFQDKLSSIPFMTLFLLVLVAIAVRMAMLALRGRRHG